MLLSLKMPMEENGLTSISAETDIISVSYKATTSYIIAHIADESQVTR